MLLTMLDLFRPALVLAGFVLLLKATGFLTLGAMVRLGRRGGALVPLWTLAALVAGYLITPLEVVHAPVVYLDEVVGGLLAPGEAQTPAPGERLAFDPLGTLIRFVEQPPWGLWAAMTATALVNLSIIVLRR